MTSERVFFGFEIILEIDVTFYEWVNYSKLAEMDLYRIRKERPLHLGCEKPDTVASMVLELWAALV